MLKDQIKTVFWVLFLLTYHLIESTTSYDNLIDNNLMIQMHKIPKMQLRVLNEIEKTMNAKYIDRVPYFIWQLFVHGHSCKKLGLMCSFFKMRCWDKTSLCLHTVWTIEQGVNEWIIILNKIIMCAYLDMYLPYFYFMYNFLYVGH